MNTTTGIVRVRSQDRIRPSTPRPGIFGSFRSRITSRGESFGPDRTTPHGLLPALAVETLWFTRGYEVGARLETDVAAFRQDAWFDYHRVNTPDHRESFDAGVVGRVGRAGPVGLVYQWHVVHHGGQQYDVGPVSDSFGWAPGVVIEGPLRGIGKASIEGENEGFVKIVADAQYGEILGVHILHAHAGEMISEAVAVMNGEMTVEALASSIHPHPTLSEAVAEATHAYFGHAIHI